MSLVNRAILAALQDAAEAFRAKQIRVVPQLAARSEVQNTHDQVLHQAVYTIFRSLPIRMPEGATLNVRTRDRPGGDVEVAWDCDEAEPDGIGNLREALARGPVGDIMGVAVSVLEDQCRARTATSCEKGRRTCLLLIPPVKRGAGTYERIRSR